MGGTTTNFGSSDQPNRTDGPFATTKHSDVELINILQQNYGLEDRSYMSLSPTQQNFNT